MKTILLSHLDLIQIVRRVGLDALMDELIEKLERALVDFDPADLVIPVRDGFHYDAPAPGLIEWMPLMKRGEVVLMKIVGYHPDSPDTQQLPTILSTFGLFDTVTGNLLAVADGTFMTALRTGAASAVASRLLARPTSTTLGIIGCGAQAVTQYHAISRCFDLRQVVFHDTDAAAMASLPSRIADLSAQDIELRAASPTEIVALSDILCTATSIEAGSGPVFEDCPSRPWIHVNGVGSDVPGKTELPPALLKRSLVCPDFPAQARNEGECQQLSADEIGPELCEIARSPHEFAPWQQKSTVFDSTGWALEDHVVMQLVLDHAKRLALGTEVQMAGLGSDPRDPYEFLHTSPRSRSISPLEAS